MSEPPYSSSPTPSRPNGKGPHRDQPEPKDEFDPAYDPFKTAAERKLGWAQKRRNKVIAEIQRNRRGDFRVPTWVLAAILIGLVALCAGIALFG